MSPASSPHRTFRRVHRSPHRGVTMVLVLVTLATATILASAYLSSRDNSSRIGQNLAAASTARWSAVGGLDLATSIMETETDWRTAHTNGRMLDGVTLGPARVTVDVADLETGDPPTAESTYFLIDVAADVGGVIERVEAMAHAPLQGDAVTIDIGLTEFAVAAVNAIELNDQATVATWPAAPSFAGSAPPALAALDPAASVRLSPDSAAIDATIFLPPGAPGTMVSGSGLVPPEETSLDVQPVVMAPPVPTAGLPGSEFAVGEMSGGFNLTWSQDQWFPSIRYHRLSLGPGAQYNLRDGMTVVSDESLELSRGSRITATGDGEIVVWGTLKLDGAAIDLITDDSTMTFYVSGDVVINDSTIGDLHPGVPGDGLPASGTAGYIDPERIRIYSIPTENPVAIWNLTGGTTVKGTVFAPNVEFRLNETAALYGAATADRVTIEQDAAIYYPPTLNSGRGYAAADSPINADATIGAILDAVPPMSWELSDADAAWLAETAGVHVRLGDDQVVRSMTIAEVPPTVVSNTTPTPRTQPVARFTTSAGIAVRSDLEERVATLTGRSSVGPSD